MSDRIVIRRESPGQPDVQALLAGLDRYLSALYPPEANHLLDLQALSAPGVSFFVGREDGVALATAAVRLQAGEPETNFQAYGEIKRMFVDPVHRGRRLGERLLAALESTLRDQGRQLALLETGPLQVAAVRLYERCGYAPRAAFGGYPDNGLSVYYTKTL